MTETQVRSTIDDGGLDMAEELRSVLRWEEKRMGAVSRGVLKSVIDRLEKLSQAPVVSSVRGAG